MIKVNKNKILVQQMDTQTELGNGLSITNETQSRKDVIKGKVIVKNYELYDISENDVVYFPLYAALPLSYKGTNYLIVDMADVLAYDSEDFS